MMTAEDIGLVIRESRAVEAEVIAPLVVGVRLTHSEVRRKSCSGQQDKDDGQGVEGPAAVHGHRSTLMKWSFYSASSLCVLLSCRASFPDVTAC